MTAWYNENDSFAADWLENLIAAGLIAPGVVDRRSIVDVQPEDLDGFTQHHAFAGIGGWSYALRLAGWPDDRPVWTGSCPCQPFSVAGKRDGTDDARHLWPEWQRLIKKCSPTVCFGEQVASSDGRAWLATVRAELEAMGYAVGAADLCAASVGAPHIRQRLYFGGLADADANRVGQHARELPSDEGQHEERSADGDHQPEHHGADGRVADAWSRQLSQPQRRPEARDGTRPNGAVNPWEPADWLPCSDGKLRPVEPGTFPLATGVQKRVGKLRGYGNSIVPQVAAEFIQAFTEAREW